MAEDMVYCQHSRWDVPHNILQQDAQVDFPIFSFSLCMIHSFTKQLHCPDILSLQKVVHIGDVHARCGRLRS